MVYLIRLAATCECFNSIFPVDDREEEEKEDDKRVNIFSFTHTPKVAIIMLTLDD